MMADGHHRRRENQAIDIEEEKLKYLTEKSIQGAAPGTYIMKSNRKTQTRRENQAIDIEEEKIRDLTEQTNQELRSSDSSTSSEDELPMNARLQIAKLKSERRTLVEKEDLAELKGSLLHLYTLKCFRSVVIATFFVIPTVFLPDWNPMRHMNETDVIVIKEIGPWFTCSCSEDRWLDLKIIRWCYEFIVFRTCEKTFYLTTVDDIPKIMSGLTVGFLILAWGIAITVYLRFKCRRKFILSEVEVILYVVAIICVIVFALTTIFVWSLEDYTVGKKLSACGFSPIVFSCGIMLVTYRTFKLLGLGYSQTHLDY